MAIVSWESSTGKRHYMLGPTTRIGRSPENDICLPDAGVSAFHARILCDSGAWILEDASSRNGSFVNDRRQTRCELRHGDLVRIGSVELAFDVEGADEQERAKAGRRGGRPAARGGRVAGGPTTELRPLGELFEGDAEYSRVSVLDSTIYTTSVQPRAGEQPQQVARRLRASYEIACATAATLDTGEILDRVLTALFGIFDQAERAFIVLVDQDSGEMTPAAVKRRISKKADDVAISRTALEHAIHEREALLCRDAAADERFAKAQSIMSLGIRSMLIAPLVFRDEVFGAVHIDSVTGVREFTPADLELLSVAASQVAGCLANVRLHQKAVAAERLAAVGQTVAGLSHCVKNILQGVKGGAFILDRGLEKGNLDRVRTAWATVKRNNAFMEDLVFDLLSYSKQREPEYASTDLNALCAELCELAGERARTKSVPLACRPAPSLGPVEVDPKGLRRCVLNLVMNAIDACEGNDGAVSVEVRAPAEDGWVRIAICDSGRGMSPQTLSKLFTVFFSTKGSKGTGLGLPVTRKIIEEHGGRIDVESQEGRGTTFTICLPPARPVRSEE